MKDDNIEILGAPHREYDHTRDWLQPGTGLTPRGGQVVNFTHRLELCGRCGQSGHRSHRCPLNKAAKVTGAPWCASD